MWGDADLTIINKLKPENDSALTYITGMNVMTKPRYFINKPELKGNDTLWVGDASYINGKTPLNTGRPFRVLLCPRLILCRVH